MTSCPSLILLPPSPPFPQGPSWGSVHQNRPITADQLAMALAMATGAMGGNASTSGASTSSSTTPQPGTSSSNPQPSMSTPSTPLSALTGRQLPSSLFAQPPVMPSPPPPALGAGAGGQSRLISPTFFQQAMQAALDAHDSESNSSNNAGGNLRVVYSPHFMNCQ